MAAVYKTVSKKKAQLPAEPVDDEDIDMEELLNDADDTTDSEEEEEEQGVEAAKKQLAAGQMPKTRVLILTSRGVSHRYGIIVTTTKDLC
ncbi:ribosome biogenesis protein brx1 [Penicillium riverlandense]|uniref:ribosome biogenesis protein brx1 n=1 Tax=Penicillium riverlandense TaxID=1903569 RepID=UPI00254874F4|nr:ribosome biogenesis protein brx1 [Penicillium riverlandense]KAJ5820410.1 ribosome biogenesis protein brx1 [Penicillium riverlandense]